MPLDYEFRLRQGKQPGTLARFLTRPVGKATLAIYFVIWIWWIVEARLPARYRGHVFHLDDVYNFAICAAFLNAPLVARVSLRHLLCRRHADYRLTAAIRATTALALLFPVILAMQIPMEIGFLLSRPAMNGIRQWALLHPNGRLPPQRIGVYWADGITATPDGVRFRVCGSTGQHGSRSGFASGSTADEIKEADVWATWDPTWKAWGWDY